MTQHRDNHHSEGDDAPAGYGFGLGVMRKLCALVMSLISGGGDAPGNWSHAASLAARVEGMLARWMTRAVARQLGVEPDEIVISLRELRRGFEFDIRWADAAPCADDGDATPRLYGGGRWTLEEVMAHGRILRAAHRRAPSRYFNRHAQFVRRYHARRRAWVIGVERAAFARPAAGACRMALVPP